MTHTMLRLLTIVAALAITCSFADAKTSGVHSVSIAHKAPSEHRVEHGIKSGSKATLPHEKHAAFGLVSTKKEPRPAGDTGIKKSPSVPAGESTSFVKFF